MPLGPLHPSAWGLAHQAAGSQELRVGLGCKMGGPWGVGWRMLEADCGHNPGHPMGPQREEPKLASQAWAPRSLGGSSL